MTTRPNGIALIDACFAFTGEQEGNVLWPYLDNAEAGNPTVGRGHMLYSPAYAANVFGVDLATAQEQMAALGRCQRGKLASYYEHSTTLRLTPEQSDEIFRADLETHLANCRDYVPGFDGLPQPVQVACNDIDLNVKGGIRTFPAMLKAIAARDWQKAADESNRPQLPNRSIATRNLILGVLQPVS